MSFDTSTPGSPATILIVDDEAVSRRSLARLLRGANYTIKETNHIADAARILNQHNVDLVVADLRSGSENGLDMIGLVNRSHPGTESILLADSGLVESLAEAVQAGASDYVTKPFSNDELLLRVSRAIELKKLKSEIITLRQNVAMSYGFDNIVGISRKTHQVMEAARRIAPTDIPVLITGASGTGKELFARVIHHHSRRRSKPLVAIDCSAIPESLLESELFGHAEPAFASATESRAGLLEEADGGTVFLDEVSNMPAAIQVRLLRFLQDSVIPPAGSTGSRKVDVRIIAATNQDLSGMVSEGEFSKDLYHRLNVIPLILPSLMDRAEDIEILTRYFLSRISSEQGKPELTISREAVDKLLSHTWPGNVRELENTLKRGAALCRSNNLEADDITFIGNRIGGQPQPAWPTKTSLRLKGNLLDNHQRTLIMKALNDNSWNYTKTAAELGIGRTTLWRKIKKYELSRETVPD
jgi:two-component system response regulator HydG